MIELVINICCSKEQQHGHVFGPKYITMLSKNLPSYCHQQLTTYIPRIFTSNYFSHTWENTNRVCILATPPGATQTRWLMHRGSLGDVSALAIGSSISESSQRRRRRRRRWRALLDDRKYLRSCHFWFPKCQGGEIPHWLDHSVFRTNIIRRVQQLDDGRGWK